MKKIFIISLFILVTFIGCSNARTISNTTSLNNQKDIEIKAIHTVSYDNIWLKGHEAGLKIEVINNTNEVKYINWSSSSLSYGDFTSRIITGNDRTVNVNSIVPNTAILPNGKTTVIIIAADAISFSKTNTATYINVDPPMDNLTSINLIISYSGSNVQNLKQAIYNIKI